MNEISFILFNAQRYERKFPLRKMFHFSDTASLIMKYGLVQMTFQVFIVCFFSYNVYSSAIAGYLLCSGTLEVTGGQFFSHTSVFYALMTIRLPLLYLISIQPLLYIEPCYPSFHASAISKSPLPLSLLSVIYAMYVDRFCFQILLKEKYFS